jgi:excisionase family DNA binding protein
MPMYRGGSKERRQMVATKAPPRGPVTSEEHERPALIETEALLRGREGSVFLADEHGKRIELPETAVRLVQQVVRALAKGNPVEVHALPKEFSIQRAADLLDVPVTEVVRLLDSGEIPVTPAGEFRRIRFEDLLVYKARRDAERREGLRELTRLAEEMGGYDLPSPSEVPSSDNGAKSAV